MVLENRHASSARNVGSETSGRVLVPVDAVGLVRSPIGSPAGESGLPVHHGKSCPCLRTFRVTKPWLKNVDRATNVVDRARAPAMDGLVRTVLYIRSVDLAAIDRGREANELF